MNRSPHFVPSPSNPYVLEIFFTQISHDDIQSIQDALKQTYGDILEIKIAGELEPPHQTYNKQRGQYNADPLLRYLLAQKKKEIAIWVLPQDLYTRNMNFIFGFAFYFQGAVLSLCRLSTKELRGKEAIHEIGHILGLTHCTNNCVMQYSNSLWEAQRKPLLLCNHCKKTLNI